jgi:hypothetical protein
MPTSYTDIDRLILDRWDEVTSLIEAREELQDRIGDVIEAAGDRIRRWLQPLGYELEVHPRDAEFHAYRTTWTYKKKGPAVAFLLKGCCPKGYRRNQQLYPSLWLNIEDLEKFKIKEDGRRKFSADLRNQLGSLAAGWDDDGCDDATAPLGRDLTDYDSRRRCELVSSSEALSAFAVSEFSRGFELADAVDLCLQKVLPR